jgi:gluconokinase
MGVSGAGKTTVGRALADHLQLPFLEGDALHPPANVAKMAAGIPLTDADRWPWLDRIGEALQAHRQTGAVATCSALKRAYRDRLRSAGVLQFVYLDCPQPWLAERMLQRQGHFMPASQLANQLATLEKPAPDEALTFDGTLAVEVLVRAIAAALDLQRI